MGLIRFFHSTVNCQNINKSALALLRKKTGFALVNIRKALEINENDIVKTEEWLRQQAKELGWNKVLKVQDRPSSQGLIGIAVEKKKVALVEVNCETDFVARNDKFKSLVELVARTCLQQPVLKQGIKSSHKVEYDKTQLGNLKSGKGDGDFLKDHLAVLIGSIGENMAFKRALCYETSQDEINVAVAVHPPSENSEVLLGKFGAFIAYEKISECSDDFTNDVPVDICKHIIGMNPLKIGEFDEKTNENNVDEIELMKQNFVFDDSITVGELLKSSGLRILDFKRFQCGETETQEIKPESKENEESVKKAAGIN